MIQESERPKHILELDGVRGIAVIGVMLLHFHAPWAAQRPFGPLSSVFLHGWAGVDLFFVLSGFLITSILVSTRDASNYFSAFYARRSLRIFPLAFLMIAAFYWVGVPLAHRHGQLLTLPDSEQIWYWLFLGNWRQGLGFNDGAELGHFWSLAIEEQFYLFFALVVRYVPRRYLAAVCVTLFSTSVLLRTFVLALGHYDESKIEQLVRLTPLHLDPVALGALLACSTPFLARVTRWRWPLLASGIAGLALSLPAGLNIVAAGVASAALVAMAATRPVPLLRHPILTRCGKYSYAMYVLHPFWLGFVLFKKYPHSRSLMVGSLILGPLLSYGMAVISWNVLEKRFLALKHRFPYRVYQLS